MPEKWKNWNFAAFFLGIGWLMYRQNVWHFTDLCRSHVALGTLEILFNISSSASTGASIGLPLCWVHKGTPGTKYTVIKKLKNWSKHANA